MMSANQSTNPDHNRTPALELSHLHKKFGSTQALSDLSLTIERGEVVCLVGHSGCGKTTLLKIISGVDSPDGGSVCINGTQVAGHSGFVEPENRKVGVVFQDYALFPHLTIEQNIMFGLRKMVRAQARNRARDMLELVNLTHMSDKYPHMLSGGEQQRIALARALAPKPDILLMDEPFSNLDRSLRDQLRHDTISLLRKLGTTVVFVTHDAEEALSTGDKIVLMRSGHIIQTGSPRELYDKPCCRYTADFFCDYNIIHGTIRSGQVDTAIGCFVTDYTGDECPAVVYLRPCDICPSAAETASEHTISAHIQNRIFRGDMEELTLKVGALAEPLKLRTPMRLPAHAQTAYIEVNRDRALVFKL
ncbi:ABC transporter ATP-binding protein [Paenochrobactrum glaciei]|uniref:ABC transporter ATP-binding protein n=2 Tax=Paenochrobactrum glaciei TaxID=486407 RepID=A0ABN1GEI1_9HYPH